jgi:hypothetical protein
MCDDITFHFLGHTPLGGAYDGLTEVLSYFGGLQQSGAAFKFESTRCSPTTSIQLRCWRARRSGSGKRIEQKVVHVFHVNADGKATDWWNLWEDQAALDDLLFKYAGVAPFDQAAADRRLRAAAKLTNWQQPPGGRGPSHGHNRCEALRSSTVGSGRRTKDEARAAAAARGSPTTRRGQGSLPGSSS